MGWPAVGQHPRLQADFAAMFDKPIRARRHVGAMVRLGGNAGKAQILAKFFSKTALVMFEIIAKRHSWHLFGQVTRASPVRSPHPRKFPPGRPSTCARPKYRSWPHCQSKTCAPTSRKRRPAFWQAAANCRRKALLQATPPEAVTHRRPRRRAARTVLATSTSTMAAWTLAHKSRSWRGSSGSFGILLQKIADRSFQAREAEIVVRSRAAWDGGNRRLWDFPPPPGGRFPAPPDKAGP